jgi:L-alanine-DL-glutamate epimerase-like enolase superfamily enzyme
VNSPTFEFLSPLLWDSPIRTSLVQPEPLIEDGRMPLPVGAGLGIELDADAVERFRVDRPA